jgi:hypothetical protein
MVYGAAWCTQHHEQQHGHGTGDISDVIIRIIIRSRQRMELALTRLQWQKFSGRQEAKTTRGS